MPFLDLYNPLTDPAEQRALLFDWLCNRRDELYAELREHAPILGFPTRVEGEGQFAYLLTRRAHIEFALANCQGEAYDRIGRSVDMPGLPPLGESGPNHATSRKLIEDALRAIDAVSVPAAGGTTMSLTDLRIAKAAAAAFNLPEKTGSFDLVQDYARTAACYFLWHHFGLSRELGVVLPRWTARTHELFIHGIFARHFVAFPERRAPTFDPAERLRALYLAIQAGRAGAPGTVLHEVATGAAAPGPEEAIPPIRVALHGFVDNVAGGVCYALQVLRSHPARLAEAVELAVADDPQAVPSLEDYLLEAMRLDPPAPFLPRRCTSAHKFEDGSVMPTDGPLVLAIGSAMRDGPEAPEAFDPSRGAGVGLCFGADSHRCVGERAGRKLMAAMLRHLLRQPEFTVRGEVRRRWGAIAESCPATTRRLPAQSPLNLVMRIKSPASYHAAVLKASIKLLAPNIEKALTTVGTVHFARFVFLEHDTRLGLFTSYDGTFEDYLQDFIEEVGDLFDLLLEHLEDAPPRPVREHREQFIECIRKHDLPPAGGYFFCAYPEKDARLIAGS